MKGRWTDRKRLEFSPEQMTAIETSGEGDCNRSGAIDNRTKRHEGYGISQRKRKRVDEVFGWMNRWMGSNWVKETQRVPVSGPSKGERGN